MIGPDHYLEAEQWLRYATDLYQNGGDGEVAAGQLAAAIAQGHAQLAQAAATAAVGELDGGERIPDHAAEWRRVLVDDPDPELETT